MICTCEVKIQRLGTLRTASFFQAGRGLCCVVLGSTGCRAAVALLSMIEITLDVIHLQMDIYIYVYVYVHF